MQQSQPDVEALAAVKAVREGMVRFPETVFPLGGDIHELDGRMRELDIAKRLGIGNVLDATPVVWVHLDPFAIGSRLVTNAEYAEFLNHVDEEGSFYDSPELWHHIWTELGLHVDTVETPYRAADGEVHYFEETYSACSGFVDAYVQSIIYEIQYVFLGLSEERTRSTLSFGGLSDDSGEEKTSFDRELALRRLFAFVKYKLRGVIAPDSFNGSGNLTDEEQDLIRDYTGPEKVVEDVESLGRELRRSYGKQVDRRLQQMFQRGQLPIESLTFLERFAAAVRESPDITAPISLRSVLYPREWKSSGGQVQKRRLMGTAVPWGEVPVTGISFFEAVSYATWLSSVAGVEISLPNEAQYERAASWPAAGLAPGRPIPADLRPKMIFPWQDHTPNDFNYYFSREGFELEGYYQKSRNTYQELLEATARKLEDGRKIYQLTGFGWHWTCDRYGPTEVKYSRFRDPDYPRFTGAPCVDRNRQRVDVFHYVPNRNPRDSLTVLRGAPDVLGGPGLTTRRYAAYPFRGYGNVGFRVVSA